jgi:hypothetical protein
MAAEFYHEDVAQFLLAKKADANAKDGLHRTPLLYAASIALARRSREGYDARELISCTGSSKVSSMYRRVLSVSPRDTLMHSSKSRLAL